MKKLTLGALAPFVFGSLLHGAAALSSIPFTTSQAQFANGDSITVQEVLATSPNLILGDTFIVRGTYTLQSHADAVMGISLSTTEPVGVPNQASARKQITAGTGTFEMEYTIQFAGSVYIAFTPLPSGNSFGRIYLAGASTGGGGGGAPTVPPPIAPIDTTGLSSVPFTTSRVQFAAGDSITIEQVLASSPRLEPGDTVVARGRYTLQSRATARLGISLTVNSPGWSEPVAPNARLDINAGSGTFELAYSIQQPGALHVTFYPGGAGGESFGGVYFAAPGSSGTTGTATVAINNPSANTGTLGNLSVRSLVSAGDGALIAGISVSEHERYVVIRGIGPSLGAFGVTGALRKPQLTVYTAGGQVFATAGSWSSAYGGDRKTGIEMLMRSVGAFPLTSGSEDAVLNLRLPPGGYTVSLGTADGQPGVALLEVYSSATFTLPNP
jgi:hypothetical protein